MILDVYGRRIEVVQEKNNSIAYFLREGKKSLKGHLRSFRR